MPIVDAFAGAAEETLCQRTVGRRRPWISQRTLGLIEERSIARRQGDRNKESSLAQSIRKSVKTDRSDWLNDLVASGDWASIRKLKKGPSPAQGRLKNAEGVTVDSDLRADTLADHLQNVQWRVRPAAVYRYIHTYIYIYICIYNVYIYMYVHMICIHMILFRLFWFPDGSPKIESRNVVFAHSYAYASASAPASASDTASASASAYA